MSLRFLCSAVLIACLALPADGFNALGHKVVAEIAWRQLPDQDRQQIVEVLRRHPRFDADFAGKMTDDVLKAEKSTQDRWIFQHAATWPDIARGLPAGERSKFNRPTWHYVNLPLYLDTGDRRALAPRLTVNISADYPSIIDAEDYNVLQAIQHSQAALKSRAGADVKALAYCWLFHVVGDIHQPLHSTALFSVGQFPDGDRGGNDIPLRRGENLHALWDGLLGRQHYLRNVDKEVGELNRQHREVWESAGKKLNPSSWAEESHSLCESVVYSDAILDAVRDTPLGEELSPVFLPTSYYKNAGDVARQRIIAAGVRLGVLLGGAPPDLPKEPDLTDRADPPDDAFEFGNVPPMPLVPAPVKESPSLSHWLNTTTGVRHNSGCRNYQNTKRGRMCTASEGKACGICGG